MSVVAQVPKGQAAKKPPHGQACTRCGLCCEATLCPLGRHVFGIEIGPCPALSYDADGSVCGLTAEPMRFSRYKTIINGVEAMRKAALHLIGSGMGCDARINGEPPDKAFYERMFAWERQVRGVTNRAQKLWGMK